MKLLLDTHVWLWQLLDAERLSPKASGALEDPGNELFLSPISVWEALLLGERGRVELLPNPQSFVRTALSLSPTTMIEVTHDIALKSRDLPGYPAQDPADRFLVAAALVHDLTLLTADTVMRRYRPVRTLW